jgi:3-oxoacyl-[acyl-carrier-protein] synthase II
MTQRRVVITGIGMVTPLGVGREAFWSAATAGHSGVRRIRCFDPSSFRTQVAGECLDFDPTQVVEVKDVARTDRFTLMAMAATDEALVDAGLRPDPERIGVIIGSGMGGATTADAQYDAICQKGPRWVSPLTVPMTMHNAAGGRISMRHDLRGPGLTVSTACASGAHAIGEAARMIRHGYADAMVAGGAEAPLAKGFFIAWNALRVMAVRNEDPAGASRPFSKDRTGFVMSEGATILVLEERETAVARGAAIYAELPGYAVNNDAYHATRPSLEGETRAMRLALEDAGCAPEEVDYVSAHGTATAANDITETQAIKAVLGERAYSVPISSIKSMIGHSIGAAGAIECAASCLSIRDGIIPPTINLDVPDPQCDLDYVSDGPRRTPVTTVISNSFGFGGCNAILVLRKHSPD